MTILNHLCLGLIFAFCEVLPEVNNWSGINEDLLRGFITDENVSSRIVGGENIDIEDVPYQISLQFRSRHFCGGAIVTPIHIVTAAHCTYLRHPYDLSVRAGSTYRDYGGVIRRVQTVFNHPYFNINVVDYDISVLKLVQSLPLSIAVLPVELALRTDYWPPGTEALISGWGVTREGMSNEQAPKNLKGVILEVLDREICRESYDFKKFTDRMLCVGNYAGGMDSCQGDSGGPMVINGVLAGGFFWKWMRKASPTWSLDQYSRVKRFHRVCGSILDFF